MPVDARCISKSYLGAWISIDMSALVDTLPKSFVDIELLASILFSAFTIGVSTFVVFYHTVQEVW